MPVAAAQSIALGTSLQAAEEERVKAEAAGARVLALGDDAYPERRKEIYDPPPVL